MPESTGTILSVLVAIAAFLVCVVTVLVGILTFIGAYIAYIHWRTGKEYEEDIRKKREEVKREFEDFIQLSPMFGKISSRLALSLIYSQQMRTATGKGPIDKFSPFVREALDGVINIISGFKNRRLKYGKEEFIEFRKEVQDVKYNLEHAKETVQDLIAKCKDIIDGIDGLSFE